MNVEEIVQQLRERKDQLETAIRSLEGIAKGTSGARTAAKSGRHMSAEARARIGAAMKKRWAERKRLQKKA